MVDSEIIVNLLCSAINEDQEHYEFIIIDGWSCENLKYFLEIQKVDIIINLDITENEILLRLKNRLGRDDDLDINTIKKRIQIYNDNILQISKLEKIHNIDASKKSEDMYNEFKNIYENVINRYINSDNIINKN